jgi:two-component system, OmpR family, sensor kinase
MATIRSRLTTSYAIAMVATMLVFAVAVFATRRSGAYRELERTLAMRADIAMRILKQAQEAGESPIQISDSLVGPVLRRSVVQRLRAIPGYVVALDENRRGLYLSDSVTQLDVEDRLEFESAVRALGERMEASRVALRNTDVLLIQRRDTDTSFSLRQVIVGANTDETEASPRELLGFVLLLFPFVLLVSLGTAYAIAGKAVQPIDQVRTEVEAITDGRSLHRRLPAPEGADELARLTNTLNAMIGRLEQSFSGLRRFTADASHELKTPLAVLRADVERAMHAHPNSNEQAIALEEALHETTRMAGLVDSLLTLARADEGRFDLHREPVDLEPLVKEVFETATILGEAARLSVTMRTVEPSTVLGDPVRLRQLFLNLVTNAIKYTPRGGEVELSLSRRDSEASFSVRDTGIGISAADLPYIFERFWRADRSRSRAAASGGFGLGLAISQWIAQAHGGSLTVQSRLHRGSTFTVSVPIGEVHPPAVDEETVGATAAR